MDFLRIAKDADRRVALIEAEKTMPTKPKKMAVLAEGDAQNRADLIYLEKLPLFNPDGTVME